MSARPMRGASRAISATRNPCAGRAENAAEECLASGNRPVVAEAIADFSPSAQRGARRARQGDDEPMEAIAAGHPLAGQTIVFTGRWKR